MFAGAPCNVYAVRRTSPASFAAGEARITMDRPAFAHASMPPSNGLMRLNPARFRCSAAIAAVASLGQEQ